MLEDKEKRQKSQGEPVEPENPLTHADVLQRVGTPLHADDAQNYFRAPDVKATGTIFGEDIQQTRGPVDSGQKSEVHGPALQGVLTPEAWIGTHPQAKEGGDGGWSEQRPPEGESGGELPDVAPVSLTPTEQSFTPEGGSGTFVVEMTGPGVSPTWTVDIDGGATTWINLMSPPLHVAQSHTPGSVTFAVAVNEGVARAGNFYVNGKVFVVSQSAVAGRKTR